MHNLLIILMFAASLVHAAWSDYEEARDLTLDAGSLRGLRIEAGAGSLEVTGVPSGDRIVVSALIQVPDADDDEAAGIIDKHMVLSLVQKGDMAELKGYFDSDGRMFGDSPSIRLQVRVPAHMSLDVEDGSGSLAIRDVSGDIDVEDGSGSIRMTDVGGTIKIDDGSGSLEVIGAGGDIDIVDGSGSVSLERIAGSASISDGSGSIRVTGVAGDVNIPESGSGSVSIEEVQGQVVQGD